MFKKNQITKPALHKIGGFEVEVTRKPIKNLYLKVSPLTGQVRISAPYHVSEQNIEQFVASRAGWIRRQLAKKPPAHRTEKLKFVTDEVHFFKGKDYLLDVRFRNAPPEVKMIEDKIIVLQVRSGTPASGREKVLNEWYRTFLKRKIPGLIAKWEPVMGVHVKEFGVKRMKTRWGTCNIRARRIWLSLELAKKSPECLEYVVVHEMVHLLERLHNRRFYNFMDRFLPDWKERKKELNGKID